MKAETINYKDVRGKELLYLKMTNTKGEECLINIGEKTFKSMQQLIEQDKPSDKIKEIIAYKPQA